MARVHFIDLVEITLQSEEEHEAIDGGEELRGKLKQAETSYRQEKEMHDNMLEDGLAHAEQMKKITADNLKLSSKVSILQQQMANIKTKREEEEAQRRFEEEIIVRNQSISIRRMEKKNQKLKEQNENLTVELDQLCLRQKPQDHLEKLRTIEKELEHELEEIQEALSSKDDEIMRKSLTLVQKLNEIEKYLKNIEALRQEQRELREQLRSAQEEQKIAAQRRHPLNTTATKSLTLDQKRNEIDEYLKKIKVYIEDEDNEHQDGKTGSWWHRCAMSLWKGVKVTGFITLCVLLSVGIMAPVCICLDPDSNVWRIALDELEPYHELKCIQPTPF